jgi:hypothetical protein
VDSNERPYVALCDSGTSRVHLGGEGMVNRGVGVF